ncbi:hypothetical protein [Hymenobacter sp. YC55]|uniref:hypothetical protein n=1 Tax=Hymenobacter sp. YC55 TaxID=3034019 RepID=UPI0023F84E7E|nr:hypothetical protein [Hymenobacter sp. YC55]MDF7815300.1 hypothetical protein [Hymenobacter sp. YC55]
MANFSVTLDFIALSTTPAPRQTDLLFFNAAQGPRQQYARGWVELGGEVVLIEAQWKPTHYAHVPDFNAAAEQATSGLGKAK